MKKFIYGILLLALCGGIGYGIYVKFVRKPENTAAVAEKPQASSGRKPVMVSVATVTSEEFKEIYPATGSLEANEIVDLRSETSGKVFEIFFKEGSPVQQDQLLVKIDDRELLAQLQKAESVKALNEARERRQKILFDKDIISSDEYDNALTNLNTAIADIDLLKVEISKTEIRAPFAGTIGIRSISPGDYISPSSSIATLVSTDPIKVLFDVPEKYSSRIYMNMPILFTVEGQAGIYEGIVFAIEPRVDIDTRTIRLKASCDNENGTLVPGAFVKVQLELQSVPDAVMIPSEAIISDATGQSVYVLRDGKAFLQKIQIGTRTKDRVRVLNGLKVGEKIITSGLLQISNGSTVTVLNGNAKVE